MRKNYGFTIVETILILVIVGILGGTGWYVWNASSKTNNTYDTANQVASSSNKYPKSQATTPSTQKTDPYAGWKTYSSKTYGFGLKYPGDNTWSFSLNETADSPARNAGNLVDAASVSYGSGSINAGPSTLVSIQVVKPGSDYDGGSEWGDKQFKGNNLYTLYSKSSVKNNGLSGTRWEYRPKDNQSDIVIYYYFQNSKFTYKITVDNSLGTVNGTNLNGMGEKIYDTLNIN